MMINLNKVWNDNPFDQWTEEELLCMEGQGICYGKGSSAPPPPPTVTTQTQVSEFPTELRPFISDIFEKSQAVQEQRQAEGFQPELTQQLAPFTGDQQTAFEGIRQQVGQTRPLFNEATELARSSARGATDPAELAALMNPFLRNVVDTEKREAERVADVQEQQLAARAAQAGAFGGSRAGIIEAERQRNLATQLGDIETRGLALAFNDAQNRLQNQFGREASAAGQLASLGTAIPAQTFKELGALSGIGAAEQQQGQRALDIATQQAREEFGFPQQTLQDFSSILRGFPLPATTNVSKSTFSPAQPLSTQLIGLGAGLAGLAGNAGAFGKAGGRVGALAPIGLKNGGYVKLAGGGGLGEMMQKNLPSNRVRMGKVAYQDASGVPTSPVAPIPPGTLYEMTQEILKILENEGEAGLIKIQSKFPREAVNFALAQADSSQTSPPVTGTAGDTATAAITKASQTGRDTLVDRGILSAKPASYTPPTNRSKDPKDLSFLQKAFGVADDIAEGVSAAKPVTIPLGPKMGVKVPQVEEQAQTVTTALNLGPLGDTPIKPKTEQIGVADRFAMEKEMQLSGRGFPGAVPPALVSAPPIADGKSIGQLESEQASQTLDPGGAAPALDKMRPGLIQRIRSQFPYAGSVSPTLGTIAKDAPPPPPAALPLITQMGMEGLPEDDGQTRTRGMSQYQIEGEIERGRRQEEARRRNVQDDVGASTKEIAQERSKLFSDPTGGDELIETDSITDITATSGRGTGGKEIDLTDLQETTRVTEEGPAADPTGKVETQARRELGEYYKDAEKILGKPPEFEKGEESDFTSRKWLALAQFGTNMLRAGGDKTVFQAMGEAAQPALKELISISKEEKKLKGELRKERNAEKRRGYSDKIAKLGIAQKLQGADLDHTKAMADIEQKRKRGILDQKTLNETIRKNNVMMDKARVETAKAQFALDSAKDGTTTLAQAQAEINKAQEAMAKQLAKTQSLLNQPVDAADNARRIREAGARAAAIYAPTTFRDEIIDGVKQRVKVDLTQFLAPATAAKTDRTTYTAGQGAPKKKGR